MKNLLASIAVVVICGGCGFNPDSAIIGTWANADNTNTWTFKADGAATQKLANGLKTEWTYKIAGSDKLYLTVGGTNTTICEYYFSGSDKLSILFGKGDERRTVELKRKTD